MNDTRSTQTLSERIERSRRGEEAAPAFIPPWRRRQLDAAEHADRKPGGRFVAVHDLTPTTR